MITAEIKHKIRSVVGAENCLDGEIDRFGYSYDSSFLPLSREYRPELVVRPLTAAEVAQVMAIANEQTIPVTPRGAASGRTGGSVPLQGGISLSLDRMTRILELDEENMMVTAEPGVRTIDLYDHCAAKGFFYPPDPGSWKYSTIGGNVAENAGGMRAVKYGVTANYVMGLDVVLADGTILRTGGKAQKNVTGYDLKSLFTGSEGTLGIITAALLKLLPMPKRRGTIQILFGSLDEGCETVRRMLADGVVPASAEIMDRLCLDAVARLGKETFSPEINACLVIEIDGEDEAALASQTQRIEALAKACGAATFRVAQSERESDELWAIRRQISSAVAALAPHRLSEDISVPRAAFPEVVRRIQAISEASGFPIAVFGHAGDGNIHPSVLCDLNKPGEPERVHRAIDEIFAAALAVGGTLSGEHGIGVTKRPYITRALGEAGVKTLMAVKQALDPRGILNPGKIW